MKNFAVQGVLLLVVWSGCLKGDPTDSELEAARAEWTSRIESLRGRQVELAGQVKAAQEHLAASGSIWASAMRRRLEAAVIGSEQGLSDLEIERDRLPLEVKAAAERVEALFDVRIRMAAHGLGQQAGRARDRTREHHHCDDRRPPLRLRCQGPRHGQAGEPIGILDVLPRP
jgi:hypothetical protein